MHTFIYSGQQLISHCRDRTDSSRPCDAIGSPLRRALQRPHFERKCADDAMSDYICSASQQSHPRGSNHIPLTRISSSRIAICALGGETLYVNGCFQENEGWRNVESLAYAKRFFKFSNLLRRIDLGHQLTWQRAAKSMLRKLVPV